MRKPYESHLASPADVDFLLRRVTRHTVFLLGTQNDYEETIVEI